MRLPLYVCWAAVLLAAIVMRPAPRSPAFILLFGTAFVLGAILMLQSRAANRDTKRAFETWQARLNALAPAIDVDDDGHMYEWLGEQQWEAVFAMLERTPRESRSLRQAMEAVEPGVTNPS